jgi:putative transposase
MRTRVGEVALRIPQTRGYHDADGRPLYPKSLERGVRSERAMTLAVAEMYVQGVSTRKVTTVVHQLYGPEATSTHVNRAAEELDEQLTAWRDRPIGEITYLILDARYEKIRHGGAIVPCAVLTAIGSSPDGKRSVLGSRVELSEAEHHWWTFLQSLLARGMRGMQLVISDDHAGLKTARSATLHGIPWQRCQFQTIRNAVAHAPRASMRADVIQDMKRIFNSDDAADADRRLEEMVTRDQKPAPGLADWLEANVPEALAVLGFPPAQRRRLRTTNGLERLNKEIKRRTRVATLFPNSRMRAGIETGKGSEGRASRLPRRPTSVPWPLKLSALASSVWQRCVRRPGAAPVSHSLPSASVNCSKGSVGHQQLPHKCQNQESG